MSTERSPSVEQLAMLRARLARFQLHAEAAGLWPGAVPSYRHTYPEASRAALELLRVCRDAGAIRRALTKVPRPQPASSVPPGGWTPFWFVGIRHAMQVLESALDTIVLDWTASAPVPDDGGNRDTYPPVRSHASEEHRLVMGEVCGRSEDVIDRIISDSGWMSRFRMFATPGAPRSPMCTEPWRLYQDDAAALARCARELGEILTHGSQVVAHFADVSDEEPLAVRINRPADLPRNPKLSRCVLVLGAPKPVKSAQMMELIAALVDAAEFGLSHEQAKVIHRNASRELNALCKSDADWRRALELPNGKGGYRVRREAEALALPADQMPTKYR